MEYFDPIPSYGEKGERAEDINSGEMVVVYEASLSSARKVIELLKKEGLDAAALEQPDSVMAHRFYMTSFVRIAVPRGQAAAAEALLKNWEQNCSQSVTGLAGQLRRHALYACVITALFALSLLVLGYLTAESIMLLAGVWVAAFALLANGEKISRYLKKD